MVQIHLFHDEIFLKGDGVDIDFFDRGVDEMRYVIIVPF